MAKTTTRAALYARVSTTMQAEQDLSIPAQLAEMKAFADTRGWPIAAEFIDPGFSGTSKDRPGLQAMLQAAQTGAFDILLVHELSRLSRSIFDTFEIFESLGKHNIGFASVKEPHFDFSTSGRFFLTIMAAINQYYVDMLRMHVAKAKRQRAREGLYNASLLPYGYRRAADPRRPPVIDPEAARAVKLAFELYADGKHSYQDIADVLNAEGFKTVSGRRMTSVTVDEILHNRFYTGLVVYGRRKKGQPAEIFPGQHEAIISTELFERVEAAQKGRYHGSRTVQPCWRVYLLNGIVHCDVCGRRLRAQTTPTGSYYREMSKARGYLDCPHSKEGARADLVEAQIGVLVGALELPDDWLEQLQALLQDADETVSLDNQRARLNAELRRLRELYRRGYYEDDIEAFEREAQNIQRQLDQLPRPHDLTTIEQAAVALSTMAEIWDDAGREEQRDLLRVVVDEVYVDVCRNRVTGLRPHTPFRPLFQQLDTLIEVEPGRFAPLFSPEILAPLGIEALPPAPPTPPAEAPLWPFVLTLPPNLKRERISPALSIALKVQRKAGVLPGHVLHVPRPGFPPLEVDTRKWPGVTVQSLEWDGQTAPRFPVDDASVTFLQTAFVYQLGDCKRAWLDEAARLLAVGGRWWLYDLMPDNMPEFWLFRFFPKLAAMVRATAQSMYDLYLALQERGWEVSLARETYYQPVRLTAALQIAQARDQSPWLASLPEADYQAGLKRLHAQGNTPEAHLTSYVCVVKATVDRKA